MDEYENLMRVVRFGGAEYVPMDFHINAACWNYYPKETLLELIETHKMLFGGFEAEGFEPKFEAWEKANEIYIDGWGCEWQTTEDGIVGVVTGHPLEDWGELKNLRRPDAAKELRFGAIDWEEIKKQSRKPKARGRLGNDGLQHGHTFQTLADLRGYENLMFDMADEERKLWELIGIVEEFNAGVVRRYVEAGAQWMSYPEDLGMQAGPMLSPGHFKKYIRPSYERLIKPARQAGCVVHMHSDGDIRELADDIVAAGVEIINLQDLVNGIDWIREKFAGKVCIDLDIDRQEVTRFGGPEEIDNLIREEVEKLGSKKGGLMMIYGLYPGVPVENVKALMDAMERYAGYYS